MRIKRGTVRDKVAGEIVLQKSILQSLFKSQNLQLKLAGCLRKKALGMPCGFLIRWLSSRTEHYPTPTTRTPPHAVSVQTAASSNPLQSTSPQASQTESAPRSTPASPKTAP